jgi:LAS superfamily LD-carboxypeptidase LdcB
VDFAVQGVREAFEVYDVYEADLLEEAAPDEHPLAAVVSLPRLAFDLMAKGDWATAIEVATTVGLRDVNMLTNLVFWFRHPMLVGQRIRADQPGLAREWLRIRDQIVRPALAGRPRKSPAGPPPVRRTAIPSSGLCWFGPPGEKTPELMAFMRKVYDLQVKRSKGAFVDTLPEEALDKVEGQPARKDAAAKAREMFAAARAALAAEGLTATVRIGVLSGYRSANRQFDIWQGKTTRGGGGFPHYYEKTKRARRHPRFGGEHSDKAAAYLAEVMAKLVAAPGYSNHQDGLALDLGTRKGKGRLFKLYEGSWFHNWLKDNAHIYQFEPLPTEAWHWTYRPKPANARPKPGRSRQPHRQ